MTTKSDSAKLSHW